MVLTHNNKQNSGGKYAARSFRKFVEAGKQRTLNGKKNKGSHSFEYILGTRTGTPKLPSSTLERTADMMEDGSDK